MVRTDEGNYFRTTGISTGQLDGSIVGIGAAQPKSDLFGELPGVMLTSFALAVPAVHDTCGWGIVNKLCA